MVIKIRQHNCLNKYWSHWLINPPGDNHKNFLPKKKDHTILVSNKTLILWFDYDQSVVENVVDFVTSCSVDVHILNSVPVGVQSHITCSDRNRNWTLDIVAHCKEPIQFNQIKCILVELNGKLFLLNFVGIILTHISIILFTQQFTF